MDVFKKAVPTYAFCVTVSMCIYAGVSNTRATCGVWECFVHPAMLLGNLQ